MVVYEKSEYLVDMVERNRHYLDECVKSIDYNLRRFGKSKTEHDCQYADSVYKLKAMYIEAGWDVMYKTNQDLDCRGQIERTYIELYIY